MAGGTMLLLAVAAGWVLGWADRKFAVAVDPRVEAVIGALPGANCGGCGFVGCQDYASAVVAGSAPPNLCAPGGPACAKKIAELLGLEHTPSLPFRAIVHCRARTGDKLKRHEYRGVRTCASSNLVAGVQGCTYGCLGMDDCGRSCNYDAVHVIDGLAVVDYDKCVGCGACARACPRNIISMVPFKSDVVLAVACCNKDFGKDVKAVCKVGCVGCGACAKLSELFTMEGHLPKIDYNKYAPENPGQFLKAYQKCPTKTLIAIGKPAALQQAAVAAEPMPSVAETSPASTVDRARWWG
jgi:RnfABCDGE-type electron transport complex B subunit